MIAHEYHFIMIANTAHRIICYLNASIVSFYFIQSIFVSDVMNKGLPYIVQVPVLLALCLLPDYVVKNTDAVLNFGGHDFSKDKISKEAQRKILLMIAFGFTIMMSIFSLVILKATMNGFDYSTPLF